MLKVKIKVIGNYQCKVTVDWLLLPC